jgi:hypothetical protein
MKILILITISIVVVCLLWQSKDALLLIMKSLLKREKNNYVINHEDGTLSGKCYKCNYKIIYTKKSDNEHHFTCSSCGETGVIANENKNNI